MEQPEGVRFFTNRDEARKAKGPDETVVKVGQFADGTFGLKSSRGPMMNVYAIVKQKPRIRPPK